LTQLFLRVGLFTYMYTFGLRTYHDKILCTYSNFWTSAENWWSPRTISKL